MVRVEGLGEIMGLDEAVNQLEELGRAEELVHSLVLLLLGVQTVAIQVLSLQHNRVVCDLMLAIRGCYFVTQECIMVCLVTTYRVAYSNISLPCFIQLSNDHFTKLKRDKSLKTYNSIFRSNDDKMCSATKMSRDKKDEIT